jgi:uncharacterized protein YqhQ
VLFNAKSKQETKICSIGGQAVMEGVMMKAPKGIAMSVRRADGTIVTEYKPYESKAKKGTVYGWPIIRGVVSFIESLVVGVKTISASAELYGDEAAQEEPSKFERWLAQKTGKPVEKIATGFAVVIALILAIGIFFVLPQLISSWILHGSELVTIWKSLIEGVVRLLIFLGYIAAISLMKDVRRVFMYHGAEHKTIACYEHGAELTPQTAKNYSRFHPRCGTNYLFLVMAISILFFAAVGWNANFFVRLLTRILFIPVVAGISYEVLKLAAKSDNLLARIVRAPGVALQRLTTKEPDESMLEVAITAFQRAMQSMQGQQGEAAAASSGQ